MGSQHRKRLSTLHRPSKNLQNTHVNGPEDRCFRSFRPKVEERMESAPGGTSRFGALSVVRAGGAKLLSRWSSGGFQGAAEVLGVRAVWVLDGGRFGADDGFSAAQRRKKEGFKLGQFEERSGECSRLILRCSKDISHIGALFMVRGNPGSLPKRRMHVFMNVAMPCPA